MLVVATFGRRQPEVHYHPERYLEVDLLSQHYITGVTVALTTASTYSAIIYTSPKGIAFQPLTPKATTYNSGWMVPVNKKASYIRCVPGR